MHTQLLKSLSVGSTVELHQMLEIWHLFHNDWFCLRAPFHCTNINCKVRFYDEMSILSFLRAAFRTFISFKSKRYYKWWAAPTVWNKKQNCLPFIHHYLDCPLLAITPNVFKTTYLKLNKLGLFFSSVMLDYISIEEKDGLDSPNVVAITKVLLTDTSAEQSARHYLKLPPKWHNSEYICSFPACHIIRLLPSKNRNQKGSELWLLLSKITFAWANMAIQTLLSYTYRSMSVSVNLENAIHSISLELCALRIRHRHYSLV